ncbi:rhodanese-like domain-containing protein [Paenibacillus turicensis]|uniref:rhodanese-like domain-containing protein n=1 Tax=Paenibacillus turicensis TaxID=160487 RepID=UPI003D2CC0AC
MTLIYIVVSLLAIWLFIQLRPVSSLTYVDSQECDSLLERWSNVKILDVRDASQYLQGHIPGSINISIGRLPVVWNKELSPDQKVIIFSENWLTQKKAARILSRRGFQYLYAVKGCYLSMDRKEECCANKYCY